MLYLFISLLFCVGVPVDAVHQQTGEIKESPVEVMVFATQHLRFHDFENEPVAVDRIRVSLTKYEPDLIVLESLHPSIDPETIPWNRRSYGDMPTLARLWGYKLDEVDSTLEKVAGTIERLKDLGLSTTDLRIELGKLYFLRSDLLNAGYQWWLADDDGADVTDLKRLTSNNFKDNEIRRYGFEIARKKGHEYLSSFDYHGDEAAWLGDRIWVEVRDLALKTKHGEAESDEAWNELKKQYREQYRAFVRGDDESWWREYGDIKDVREYVNHFIFDWRKAYKEREKIDNSDGLGLMRFLQSEQFMSLERRLYYDLMPKVSIKGLGKKNVENFALRNKRMVDFMEQDVQRLARKRVLIIVGSGHKLFLEDELKERGYTIIPSADFMPSEKTP